jgi:VCBS repeat-containing protein
MNMAIPGGDKEINGTQLDNILVGTDGDDLIRGKGGADSIDALGGADYLDGGPGNDTLLGGAGDDWLFGGAGNDVYSGGAGLDKLRFYGDYITGAGTASPGHDTDTIVDINFGEGDIIVLANYGAATFSGADLPGSLEIVPTGGIAGSGANIRSWVGLVELVASSSAVTASRLGDTDTLLLRIEAVGGAVQTIAIQNGWGTYSGLVNQAPTPANDSAAVLEDASTAGNVLANDSDPNGDAISVTEVQSGTGSKSVPAGGSVIVNGTYGAMSIGANGSYSYLANAAAAQALAAGTEVQDVFTYTVTDAFGKSSTAQLVVKVTGTNDAPVAEALTGSVSEDGPGATFQPKFQEVDQGDTHSITVGSAGIGKVVLNADGSFTYDANGKFESLGAGKTATDSFTYSVTDNNGAVSTETVTVTIVGVNDGPSTNADFNGVVKNGKLNVTAANGVLTNDSDVEGDTLSVSALNGSAANVGKAVQGTYGTLTMKGDGSYSYVATTKPGSLPSKTIAQDHFTYTVSDGNGGLKTETLTVTVYEKGQTYIRGTDAGNALTGGKGSDVLDGGNGNDTLSGGNGADVLLGGLGDDLMTGGLGADTFVFNAAFGKDTISDFQAGLDRLQFDKGLFTDLADLLESASQIGNDVLIDAGGGNLLVLQKVQLTQLVASDFLFI